MVLVTKDTNLRIKADAVGLTAQDYTTDKVDIADLYAGVSERGVVPPVDSLKSGGLALGALPSAAGAELQANEGVTLVDEAQPNHTLLARFDAQGQRLGRCSQYPRPTGQGRCP